MRTNVTDCPRCGGRHVDLPTTEFVRPPVDSQTWTHWTTCPMNDDPILIRVVGTASSA